MDPNIDFLAVRVNTTNALNYTAMNMKFYYNYRHIAMFFALSDWALLRLHCGYNIPSATNHKLDQQYARPFKVIEKIGRLAY
jgi:hypothetical protein